MKLFEPGDDIEIKPYGSMNTHISITIPKSIWDTVDVGGVLEIEMNTPFWVDMLRLKPFSDKDVSKSPSGGPVSAVKHSIGRIGEDVPMLTTSLGIQDPYRNGRMLYLERQEGFGYVTVLMESSDTIDFGMFTKIPNSENMYRVDTTFSTRAVPTPDLEGYDEVRPGDDDTELTDVPDTTVVGAIDIGDAPSPDNEPIPPGPLPVTPPGPAPPSPPPPTPPSDGAARAARRYLLSTVVFVEWNKLNPTGRN